MIIVKNRELLIPNNERYIGTTYDTETENRVFQVPRFSQRGVDLAALTFRLDIQYANESYDTVILDKEVGEAFIILIWKITSATLQVPGTLYIGIRAVDSEVTVKWSSFSAAMYAERHLNTPGNYGGSLTEIEQMEQDHVYMKGVVDELKSNLDYAHDAEAWAEGTRSGSAVPSTDTTYHNNSKYYSEQASAKATQAANSATAAANSATQAAETVADTNTRFNNAVAAVTSETEVIDARVGADGTVYTVLKNRLDAEHTDLKSDIQRTSGIRIGTFQPGYIAIGDVGTTVSFERTIVNPNTAMSAVMPVIAGETVHLGTNGGGTSSGGARAYAWLDANQAVISRTGRAESFEYRERVVPENAAYIVVNHIFTTATFAPFLHIGAYNHDKIDILTDRANKVDMQLYSMEDSVKYWGDDAALEAVDGSNIGDCIGIEHKGPMYIINGTNTTGQTVYLKLSGNIAHTKSSSTANGWARETELENGHSYRIRVKVLGGTKTVGGGIFIYRETTNTSVYAGISINEDTEVNIPWKYDEKALFRLYVNEGMSFSDFAFVLLVHDAEDEEKSALTETLALNAADETGVVKYWDYSLRDVKAVPTATDSGIFGVKQQGDIFTLNGIDTIDKSIRIKISGGIERTVSFSAGNAWGKTIPFIAGHTYKLTTEWLSGNANIPVFTIVRNEANDDVCSTKIDPANSEPGIKLEKEIMWPESYGKGLIILYFDQGQEFSDFKIRVRLTDLTAKGVREDYSSNQYSGEVSATAETVKKFATEPCLVFPLLTDIHYLSTQTTRPKQFDDTIKNVAKVINITPANGIICLGDITDGGYSSDPSTMSDVLYIMQKFADVGLPLYFSMGNHDDYRYVSRFLSAGQIYANYMRWSESDVVPDVTMAGTNYYRDFHGYKTRLVCVNTNKFNDGAEGSYGVDALTVTWLEGVLASTPDDYVVMLITHAPAYNEIMWPSGSSIPNVGNLRKAIKESGKTCFVMSGHTHFDIIHRAEEEDGVINIVTGCAKFDGPETDRDVETKGGYIARQVARNAGDETADLWEMIVLKPFAKKIALVRFGAGVDRIVNFGLLNLTGETTFVTELSGTVTWTTSNESVATVNGGVITPVSTGYATIKATDADGNFEVWYVTV